MLESYTRIRVVGRGGHGVAVLCKRKKDGMNVVVKELFGGDMTDDERRKSLNEIQVLSLLEHPNIISYFDSFVADASVMILGTDDQTEDDRGDSGDKMLMIVMEYANGGTLNDYLTIRKSPLEEEELLYMFGQICLALQFIHSHNILHRDIKTSNILISNQGSQMILKIGDFGISKVMNSRSKADTVVGTPSYISPELCEGSPYNDKSDIWALGCILYEMACLKRLFEASNLPALVLKIMRGTYDPMPSIFSENIRKLVAWCVMKNPTHRPDMTDIASLAFLQKYFMAAQTIGCPTLPTKTA